MDNFLDGSENSDRALPGGRCRHKDHTGCMLTLLPSCCACTDQRPHQQRYPLYVDGRGTTQTGTRWAHYCRPCALFWDRQMGLAGVNPTRSRIPGFPRPVLLGIDVPQPVVLDSQQQVQAPDRAQQSTRARSPRRRRRAGGGLRGGRGVAASTPQRGVTVAVATAEAPAAQAAEVEEPPQEGLIARMRAASLSDRGATRGGRGSGVRSESVSPSWFSFLNQTPPRPGWDAISSSPNTAWSNDLWGSTRPSPIRTPTRGLRFGYQQPATPPNRARGLQAEPPQPATPPSPPGVARFGSLPSTTSPPRPILHVTQQLPIPTPPHRARFGFLHPTPPNSTHAIPQQTATAAPITPARPEQPAAPTPDLAQLAEDASVLLELFSKTYPQQAENHDKLIGTALAHVQRIHQVISPAGGGGGGDTESQGKTRAVDGGECIVCCTVSAEVVLIPCKHLVLCSVPTPPPPPPQN